MLDPYDIPSPPIPHAPNPPPVNPPPYPGLRGKKGGEKRQMLLSIWHYEKVSWETETWKVFGEHRACFVFVCSTRGQGGGGGEGSRKCSEEQSHAWKWMNRILSSPLWQWTVDLKSRSWEQKEKWYDFPLIIFIFMCITCGCSSGSTTNFLNSGLFFPQGILNHCFDDIETFMGKLQQTAEAATVLNQRKKKNKKKSKKQSAEGKKRLFLQGDTYKNLFSNLKGSNLFNFSYKQRTYSPPRPDPHQRRSLLTSSRNSNIASACWCVFSLVKVALYGCLSALHDNPAHVFHHRPVWNQPSPILHQRSWSTMSSNPWIWWETLCIT